MTGEEKVPEATVGETKLPYIHVPAEKAQNIKTTLEGLVQKLQSVKELEPNLISSRLQLIQNRSILFERVLVISGGTLALSLNFSIGIAGRIDHHNHSGVGHDAVSSLVTAWVPLLVAVS